MLKRLRAVDSMSVSGSSSDLAAGTVGAAPAPTSRYISSMTTDVLIRFFYAGQMVSLVGHRDADTASGCWEWFEVFAGTQCLNDGNPIYTDDERMPPIADVIAHLDKYSHLRPL